MSRILPLALAVLLFGCGGGGGGGGDTAAPTVVICFPTTVALTDGATVTVRGTATDTSAVTAIVVNGVAATTTDGFANWVVDDLPLLIGANVIAVDATDSAGNNNPAAATVTVTRDPAAAGASFGAGVAFAALAGIVIDEARNRLLVSDGRIMADGAILAVDLATGNRSVVSDSVVGGGAPTAPAEPGFLGADLAGSVLYVADPIDDLVYTVNIITGARAVVSDSSVGGAPTFTFPSGIVHNPGTNSVLLADRTADRILSFTVAAGNTRTILSDNTNTGPTYTNIDQIELDVSNNRALVTERATPGAIIAVDLTSGDKTTISSDSVGTGGPAGFDLAVGLALDLANNRAVTHLTSTTNATIFVDLATGNKTTISQNGTTGVGPDFVSITDLDYLATKQLVFIAAGGAIYVVDAVSGDRVFLSK